jgi:transposase
MKMDYPTAVLEKAKRVEQLLQGVAGGEPLDEVNEALGLKLGEQELVRAQAKYETGGCRWEALMDGRYGHAQKVHSGIREWLYTRKERDEEVRAPQLAREIKEQFGVEVAPGHINYLLRTRGLTAPPGRPGQQEPAGDAAREVATAPGETLDNAGLFFPGGSEGGHGGGGSD